MDSRTFNNLDNIRGISLLTSGSGHAHIQFKREKSDGTTMVVGGET